MQYMFKKLRSSCEEPPVRTYPSDVWILQTTWELINHRAILCQVGSLSQHGGRELGCQVRVLLKQDSQQRAANAANQIEQNLATGDPMEACWTRKGWYRTLDNRAPKPC